MKIAVTYDNGSVFQHFGKTEFFKMYTIENGAVTGSAVTDTNGASHHGLADFLHEQGVDAVICGGLGQGMYNALAQYGISVFAGAEGDADSAVDAFLDGQLGAASEAMGCSCHEHGGHHHCA